MNTGLQEKLSQGLAAALPRLRRRQTSFLAAEIWPVAVGLRTAALIDSVLLTEDDSETLAKLLCRLCRNVRVVSEAVSGQVVIVNRDLLASRRLQHIVFVEVGGPSPDHLPAPPKAFFRLLDQIDSAPPLEARTTLALADPERPQDLIPLVGYLLDYAVAYVSEASSPNGKNCLGGIELILIEVRLILLRIDIEETRRLCSFSYPACLVVSTPPLEPSNVIRHLKVEFDSRLSTALNIDSELSGARIEVISKMVTLDQVAL